MCVGRMVVRVGCRVASASRWAHELGPLPPTLPRRSCVSLSRVLTHLCPASSNHHPPPHRYLYDKMDALGPLADASIQDIGFVRGAVISVRGCGDMTDV